MITGNQLSTILERAYVPEQVTDYVTAVSGAEPFLFGDFIAYRKEEHLIFIGYPLGDTFEEKKIKKALEEAVSRFKPVRVALTAPCVPASVRPGTPPSFDQYYRLDLVSLSISQKVRNMINRAGRMMKVEKRKTLTEAHEDLIREFLKVHPVGQKRSSSSRGFPTMFLPRRRHGYLMRGVKGGTWWLSMWRRWVRKLCFLHVQFHLPRSFCPGASDLLLWKSSGMRREKISATST